MKFQQIRNATVKITYDSKTFLIDPWLAPQYMTGCFGLLPMIIAMNRRGDPRKKYVIDHCATWEPVDPKQKWIMCPMQPLPMSVAAINRDVDAYLCSHVHLDHIGLGPNGKGCEKLDKRIPIYAINRQDANYLEFSGISNNQNIRILKTLCALNK